MLSRRRVIKSLGLTTLAIPALITESNAGSYAIPMKVATVGLAPAIFGPLMNIKGSSLATWWHNKPPRN